MNQLNEIIIKSAILSPLPMSSKCSILNDSSNNNTILNKRKNNSSPILNDGSNATSNCLNDNTTNSTILNNSTNNSSNSDDDEAFCRICYSDKSPITGKSDLISPCNCNGSVKYVHHSCLKMWRMKGKTFGNIKKCEQCNGTYNIPGEKPIYTIFISGVTVLLMSLTFILSTFVFKTFFEAVSMLITEINPKLTFEKDEKYFHSCLMLCVFLYNLFTVPKICLLSIYLGLFVIFSATEQKIFEVLFFGMSFYLLWKIHNEIYENIEGMYYYMMNLNWESKRGLE